MKEILVAFAAYNRDANRAFVTLLTTLDEGVLRAECGAYYKSLLGTLEHIAQSELGWLRRFKGYFTYKSLEASPLLALTPESLAEKIKGGPAALYPVLAELDGLLVSFAGELVEATLGIRVKYKNYKGEELERPYWNLVFHILNHGTHHRGEISALLDQGGVANDFSGFNLYTK